MAATCSSCQVGYAVMLQGDTRPQERQERGEAKACISKAAAAPAEGAAQPHDSQHVPKKRGRQKKELRDFGEALCDAEQVGYDC